MSSPTVEVKALMTAEQAIEALRVLILYDEDFDHRHYSIYQAEILERCAAAIRRGYAEAEKTDQLLRWAESVRRSR